MVKISSIFVFTKSECVFVITVESAHKDEAHLHLVKNSILSDLGSKKIAFLPSNSPKTLKNAGI
jgi:hypothetical protein